MTREPHRNAGKPLGANACDIAVGTMMSRGKLEPGSDQQPPPGLPVGGSGPQLGAPTTASDRHAGASSTAPQHHPEVRGRRQHERGAGRVRGLVTVHDRLRIQAHHLHTSVWCPHKLLSLNHAVCRFGLAPVNHLSASCWKCSVRFVMALPSSTRRCGTSTSRASEGQVLAAVQPQPRALQQLI